MKLFNFKRPVARLPPAELELLVTLWPSFPHFKRFAQDNRLSAIRLNTAMVENYELTSEFALAKSIPTVPLYFDIKGRQLRIEESIIKPDRLELILNHPIAVQTPTMVLFKAGADYALLNEVKDGKHLIFDGGPEYVVKKGESLHIRHPSLEVQGQQFTPYELQKIDTAKKAGFRRYFLSYTESQRDVDEFRSYIGKDAELMLKIESKKGLAYVENEFRKNGNTYLMAARGDLFVEVDKPHDILPAMRAILAKDPEAAVGSRILLSTIHDPVPSCADLSEIAWLYDIGFRKMMLCDELCLKEELLSRAVNVFEAFRETYCNTKH
ncbi:MAG: hypothetical protein V1725_03955 [archaeon]